MLSPSCSHTVCLLACYRCCHAPTFLSHFYLFSTQTIEEVFLSILFFLFALALPLSLRRHHSLLHCFEIVVVAVAVAFFAVVRSCYPYRLLYAFFLCIRIRIAFYSYPEETRLDNLNIAFHSVYTKIAALPINHQQIQCGISAIVLSFVDTLSDEAEREWKVDKIEREKEVKRENFRIFGKTELLEIILSMSTHTNTPIINTSKMTNKCHFGDRLLCLPCFCCNCR